MTTAPQWQREFPDFGAMPELPAFLIDESWHNDTCPSFRVAGSPFNPAVRLFVDYAEPADREEPESSRFSMYATDMRGNESRPIYSGDDVAEVVRLATIEHLAGKFAELVADDLTAAEWLDMRYRNRAYAGQSVCASHEFRDANMTMAEAFESVMGRSILPDDDSGMAEADCVLWGAAWNVATPHYLTSDIEGARFDVWRLTGRDEESLAAAGVETGEIDDDGKDVDSAGRVYSPGHVQKHGNGWHVAVSNLSELFDSLFAAESFLWQMYAEAESRYYGKA